MPQVVDAKCKVFGLQGLRVADGSVMPEAVSGERMWVADVRWVGRAHEEWGKIGKKGYGWWDDNRCIHSLKLTANAPENGAF